MGQGSHPLLAAAVELASGDGLVLAGLLSLRAQPWLADHMVAGTVLVPGTGLVELALAGGYVAGCGRLVELALEAPLLLPAGGALQVQVSVGGPAPDGVRAVQVYARPEGDGGLGGGEGAGWVRHATGLLAPDAPDGLARPGEFVAWPPRDAVEVPVDGLYEKLATAGYVFGPSFRGLRAAWRRGDEIFAEVALPEGAAAGAGAFGVHPALFDAALHAAALNAAPGAENGGGGLPLPFAWTGVSVHQPGARALRVRLTHGSGGSLRVEAADASGTPVVSVASVVTRPLSAGALAGASGDLAGSLFSVDWVPVSPEGRFAGAVAVAGPGGVPLAAALAQAGAGVRAYPDLDSLAAAVRGGDPVPALVLACAGAAAGAAGDGDPASAARAETGRVLGLVQEWLGLGDLGGARLMVVTRGAVATGPGEPVTDLAGAAAWGLVRSAQSENPGRLVLADLPDNDPDGAAEALLAALAGGEEPEVAVRGGRALVRRVARPSGSLVIPEGNGPWRLAIGKSGTLEGLALVPAPDAGRELGPGEVRVAVRAAGLSPGDVLSADGTGPAGVLGREGAGVVLETGPGVSGLAPGDRVMGLFAGGAFGPVAVADARLLVPVPATWTLAQAAAAVPAGFVGGEAGPGRLREILAEVTELLASGALEPLSVRAWDIRRAPEAFRFMSQAENVGQVVLTVPPDSAAPRAAGTAVVTGGTGALGALVSAHLAAAGRAAGVVLLSRSGPAAPGAAGTAAEVAGAGADVLVAACDAADRDALAAVLAAVPASRPLTAVVHAAGVLDDGVVGSLTPARVDAVMRPKADAAWHLHELTAGLDLEAFVLFSSGAATFGAAGQGNYAAANAFLDGLAARRQAAGLPGVSLAWGMWAEASTMTGHLTGSDLDRVTRSGMSALSTADGLGLLDLALARDEALLIPSRVDLAGCGPRPPAGRRCPRWFAPWPDNRQARPRRSGRGTGRAGLAAPGAPGDSAGGSGAGAGAAGPRARRRGARAPADRTRWRRAGRSASWGSTR